MGLMQSCLGKKNKVGVMLEEEEEAYGEIEDVLKAEMEDDIIHTKPLPWLMFRTESGITKSDTDAGGSRSTVSEVVEKRGGVAFNIEYRSTVPKLPPINMKLNHTIDGKDYDKWKEERDKLLVDKHEQANIRRDCIIHERIKSARRHGTARVRAPNEVIPPED